MQRFTFTLRRWIETRKLTQTLALGLLLALIGAWSAQVKSYTFLPLGYRQTACSGWEHVTDSNTTSITFAGAVDGGTSVIGEFWYEYQNRWTHYALQTGFDYQLTLSNPPIGAYQLCWSHMPPGFDVATGTLSTTLSTMIATDTDDDGVPDEEDVCQDSDRQDLVLLHDCNALVENILFDDGCTLTDLMLDTLEAGGQGELYLLLTDLAQQGLLRDDEVEAILDCTGEEGEIADEHVDIRALRPIRRSDPQIQS